LNYDTAVEGASAGGANSRRSRVLASLLFTDVVGSTGHAARLGDRAWSEELARHYELVHGQVEAAGGRVVVTVGDGFFVKFDAPALAVQCAEAISRGSSALGLEVRCGVHVGECELLGENVVGMEVNTAARISSLAEAGEVMVSSTVRELVVGSGLEFEDRGRHELKGVPDDWQLYALLMAPQPAADEQAQPSEPPPPLSARLTAMLLDNFQGRAAELVLLREDFAAARERGLRGVLIAGEPGIGKSTLTARAAADAHAEQGAIVLHGRCDEDLGIPLQPFVEALGHYVEHAPAEVLERHVADYGGELARLVPALTRRAGRGAPPGSAAGGGSDDDRYLFYSAVAGMLAVAAARRPLVLAIEDLHRADRSTLLLLKYLLTAAMPISGLLIATYRDEHPGADDPFAELLADLRREPNVAWMTLEGLGEADVVALTREVAGPQFEGVEQQLARTVLEETDGNPFFVRELLRSLAERNELPHAAEAWATARSALGVPGGVRDVIANRVGRLGDDVQRVLGTGAVIGREFELDLLTRVVGLDEEQLLDALDAARRAALIEEVPNGAVRYSFVHALIGDTLYEHLGSARRCRLHRRVAESLEQLEPTQRDARAGEIAHHLLAAAEPRDHARAIEYARRAGDRALEQLAADDAADWYERALGLGVDEEQRCELLICFGIAQCQAGAPAFRETLLEAAALAERRGDTDRLIRAALANSRGFVAETGEVDHDRVAVLERALAAVGGRDLAARARLLATLAAEMTFSGDWQRRRELSDDALAIAHASGNSGAVTDVLSARFITIWTPETLAERLANTAEALAAVGDDGDPLATFRAVHWRAVALIESGELGAALPLIERQAGLAGRLGQPTARWIAAYDRATMALTSGDFEQAESWAGQAGQLASASGQPDAMAFYAGQLINIRFEQGGLPTLEPLIADQVEANPGIPAFRAALALARCEVGDLAGAAAVFAQDAGDGFSELPYDSNWLVGLVLYAEVCGRLGDRDAAERLVALLAPWEHQIAFNSATIWGAVARPLGRLQTLLDRHSEAEAQLGFAAALHERIGAPVWLARTRLDLAQLEIARGRPEAALSPLAQARATAQDLGCLTIAQRAAALLDALAPAGARA